MRAYVKKMIKDYPRLLKLRAYLKKQIAEYRPVTIEDVIDSMTFGHQEGERVQTSNISDKTATIAIMYQDRVNRMNEEVISGWIHEHQELDDEITFFEECIRRLSGEQGEVMRCLVLDGASWYEAEVTLCMSRMMIWDRRRRAIDELARMYQARASQMEAILLS